MQSDWAVQLLPDERLVWEGTSRPGIHFRAIDIAMTIFGLFFLAFSLALVVKFLPWGLLLPHLWVGVYLGGARFPIEANFRSHTRYALTDRRALIARRRPTKRVRTIDLTAVVDIELAEHRNGTATITFGASINPFLRRGGRSGTRPPAFEFIDDYARVMQLSHPSPSRSPQ